jgi:hypothetical protein
MNRIHTIHLALILIAALSIPATLTAQDHILEPAGRPILMGAFGGADFNMHKGYFELSERGLVCCSFDHGSGIGPVGGFRAFIPLTDEIDISPRVAFESRGGTFTSLSEPLPILGLNNEVEQVRFDNRLDVTLNTVEIGAMASYTFTDFGLYAAAGPSLGIVAGRHFTKSETIHDPAGVSYLDGSLTKTTFDGPLSMARSTMISARAGLGAKLPITETLTLNPEALYILPLTTASNEGRWKATGVQASVGVMVGL